MPFADVSDRTGRFQLYFAKKELGERFALLKSLDRGDFLGARGFVFRTKMGDLALHVRSFEVLSKGLAPLPDKWHGLVDIEKRYRQRYVDLIVNPHVRDVFMQRSKIIAAMRRFIDAQGFYECETPTLLNVAGGAAARPFITHVNALDIEMTLRIATELNLKRLIVGGLERVYEIGRIFRNEGIDTTHNPEFTMLELYAAYWSVHEMMDFNEALMAHLVADVHGGDALMYGEDAISFKRPFARIAYLDAMKQWGDLERDTLLSFEGAQAVLARVRPAAVAVARARAGQDLRARRRAGTAASDVRARLSGRALAARQAQGRRSRTDRPLRAVLRFDGSRQRVHRAQRSRRPAPPLRTADRRAGRR